MAVWGLLRLNYKWLGWCFASLLFVLPSYSDSQVVRHDLAAWQTVDLVVPISERWAVTTQWQHRLENNLTQHDTSQIWLGLARKITPNITARIGGAVMPTYRPPDNWEARLWQQLQYKKVLANNLQLTWRARNEQRFIEGTHAPENRLRQLVGVVLPIPRYPKWFVRLQEEVFIDVYGVVGGTQSGVTENRIQATVGRLLNDAMTLEVGYLNVLDVNTSRPHGLSHAIVTQMNIRPPR